jgi:hypothetical protein
MADAQPNEPAVVEVTPQTCAVVRGYVPVAELVGFFDRSFRTLGEALAGQAVEIVGPAFARYDGPPADIAALEVGFPTSVAIEPAGEVVAGSLPGGPVARTVHRGSFDELGASWARLRSWMEQHDLVPGPVLWEVYLTEPSPDMDPADLRTELNWSIEI